VKQKVVLLGASTGGPSQIKEILKEIENLSSIIIVVQHMKEEVLPFFIKDINNNCSFNVQRTPLIFPINKPSIIICTHSSIIEKKENFFTIKTDIANQHYTPDINQLFHSFAQYAEQFDTDVIIMTGIGSDGVDGASALKKSGAKVYAQDEESSPVYGMPKAAYERGIVNEVKSLSEIKAYFRSL